MKILITNNHIEHFAGSEINALQLCVALEDLGNEVDVATFSFNYPIKTLYDEKQISVINLSDQKIIIGNYDLIWSHHTPTLDYLIFNKEINEALVIFSSLSPFEPLEASPYYHNELNMILSLSGENREMLLSNGVNPKKISILPNCAPKKYFDNQNSEWPDSPQKIAVISNHPPDELRDLEKLLKEKQRDVHFFGFHDLQTFVDDNLIKKYDLIITIGKTVQYCFSLKIPVYCYDHFGGPGFINQKNIEISKYHNFSGRGINRILSGLDLLNDIELNYLNALANLDFLYKYAKQWFCLEKNLKIILGEISQQKIINFDYIRKNYSLVGKYNQLYLRNQNRLLDANHNLSQIQSQLADIHKSKTWQIVRFLRNYFRLIVPPGGVMHKALKRLYKLSVHPFLINLQSKKYISKKPDNRSVNIRM